MIIFVDRLLKIPEYIKHSWITKMSYLIELKKWKTSCYILLQLYTALIYFMHRAMTRRSNEKYRVCEKDKTHT